MERIYCDHAATTPLDDAVFEAMLPFLRDQFGNASEPHWAGREARAGLTAARERTAASLGCATDHVVFTGGASEADNLALMGRTAAGPGRIVATPFEHPAIWLGLEALRGRGYDVIYAPVDRSGVVSAMAFAELVRAGDLTCCCIWANNVTGAIQPVPEIAAICADRGVPLHVDGVQAAAGIRTDLGALPGAVTLAVAAHKLGGPKCAGALCGRGVETLTPVIHGGPHERGLRPGTESVANAVGLATALERCQLGDEQRLARRLLRDSFEQDLLARVDQVDVVGRDSPRLPGHSLALIDGVRGSALVGLLDDAGIAAAAGSACSSGSANASHAITALGYSDTEARSALRLSFGTLNSAEQLPVILATVEQSVAALRRAAVAV